MTVIQSSIDTKSAGFAANETAMRTQIETLHANSNRVA
ncbi:hypothetical protein MNBD_ALPHA05-569, partial [hydrothermal vent metagenome]